MKKKKKKPHTQKKENIATITRNTFQIQQIIHDIKSTVFEILWYSVALKKIKLKRILKIMSQYHFYCINNLKDI